MKQNKKENGTSSNEKNDEGKKFPGYPHYNKNEDIMSGGEVRIETELDDVPKNITVPATTQAVPERNSSPDGLPEENATQQSPAAKSLKEKAAINFNESDDDEIEFVEGTEADVTAEEIDELDRDGLTDHNFHPAELDVPGAELDDSKEEIGEEDEENNYYSLGGDDKENLEENS
jgi:hypothetical protein